MSYKIRNWQKYQHYKKRNPPWIKLHYELLSSKDWVTLADASRVLAIACMLIASRNEGEVPDDPEYIKRVAYLQELPDFTELLECGFLINASKLQADASKMLASASVSVSVLGEEVKKASTRKLDSVYQDLPEVIATEDFINEWEKWEKYLREVHQKPMQPMMRGPAWQLIIENAQPGKEAIYGIASIRRAMAAGWKNLYTRKDEEHGQNSESDRNNRTVRPTAKRPAIVGGDAWGDAERWGSDIPELDPETGIVERPSERAARMAGAVG